MQVLEELIKTAQLGDLLIANDKLTRCDRPNIPCSLIAHFFRPVQNEKKHHLWKRKEMYFTTVCYIKKNKCVSWLDQIEKGPTIGKGI